MTKEQIELLVKEQIVEILPDLKQESIDIEDSMKDLGANSIDRMEVVTNCMQVLSVKIPITELAKVNNVASLIDALYNAKQYSHA